MKKDNIKLELAIGEAMVLHEFVKRQLMKRRFSIGDNAEKMALLGLFVNLESHLVGYGLLNASWKTKVTKAKKHITNFKTQQNVAINRAKELIKTSKRKSSSHTA